MVGKENSLGHILDKWGVFSDFVKKNYFVDIFSESLKSFSRIYSGIAQFQQNVTKIIDLVYLFIKITGIKGQLSGSGFMELGSFFLSSDLVTFFLHPQGDLFS